MRFVIISSSLDPNSRSDKLAESCRARLTEQGQEAQLIRLRDHSLPAFDNGTVFQSDAYNFLHQEVGAADSLVLASPVYNWGCCAELKKFIEAIGSTPPDGSLRSALFDKVVTFVNAAGLPHSYMAFGATALSLMLDFKCIINPYNLYVHNRHWEDSALIAEKQQRLEKTMAVAIELTQALRQRTYQSDWEI